MQYPERWSQNVKQSASDSHVTLLNIRESKRGKGERGMKRRDEEKDGEEDGEMKRRDEEER